MTKVSNQVALDTTSLSYSNSTHFLEARPRNKLLIVSELDCGTYIHTIGRQSASGVAEHSRFTQNLRRNGDLNLRLELEAQSWD